MTADEIIVKLRRASILHPDLRDYLHDACPEIFDYSPQPTIIKIETMRNGRPGMFLFTDYELTIPREAKDYIILFDGNDICPGYEVWALINNRSKQVNPVKVSSSESVLMG